MAMFDIVDLTEAAQEDSSGPTSDHRPAGPVGGQGVGGALGAVDTTMVANELESLRADLSDHISASATTGLRLKKLVIKLSISAEGRVAFIAKGAAEASIEVTFESS